MGEPNNRRKRSKKSSPKNIKRKTSTSISTTDVPVKPEPITASPVSLPRNLELSTTEIPHYNNNNISSNDDPKRPTRLLNTLESPISKIPKNLTDIPNEIFVQICANLPPNDLFSLTLVCKKIKDLLCSPTSKDTQAIWRTSRIRFMRFLQSPPPCRMDEKSYIVLKQLEKGCQFCHEKGFVKVYWEFRVRCCESCLDKYTMSRDKLYIEYCVPNEVFRTLPHIFRDASHFYWLKDVSEASEEFCRINDEKEQQDWVNQGEEIANAIMNETLIHKQEEQSEQMVKFEECLIAQSQNSNYSTYTPQPPTPQQRMFVRQPQLTTAPMNISSMPSLGSMASMTSMNSMTNMVSTPMIPSMGTIGLTNPQSQFQQYNQIIPQMQNMMNRSQFMITTSPIQQYYSHQSFVPRITRQMISPQQQMIPHMMAGAPQILSQSQMLTPQMVPPHCFMAPQFRRF